MAAAVVDSAERVGIAPSALLEGLPFRRRDLQRWGYRLDWNDYVEIVERLRQLGGRDAVVHSGLVYNQAFPEVRRLFQAVVSPTTLYHFLFTVLGASAFPFLVVRFAKLGEDRCRITIAIPEPYRGSEAFMLGNLGAVQGSTAFIGLPPARVEADVGERRAQFDVTLPASRTLRARLGGRRAQQLAVDVMHELRFQVEQFRHFFGLAPNLGIGPEDRSHALRKRWRLTPREAEVLGRVASGLSNKTIGAELGCSERTVEIHVTRLLRKAGVDSRARLIASYWQA